MTSPAPLRVLVVDDDEDLREVLTEILGARGYFVETACDGAEALARLRAGPSPSIILLDLRMPGMSGWEFCREQRRDPALAEIPVLVLSGGSSRHVAASLGAIDVLPKPIDLDELTAKLSRHAKP
jgi:CheY-like chemotaxis protein